MPRHKEIDTREETCGQRQSFDMPSEGDIDRSMFQDNLVEQDVPSWDKVKTLAFMEEKVLVEVPKTGNPHDEQIVELGCNGVKQFLFRGVPQWIKRKFVNVLATSKIDNISTPEITDATGGRATKIDKTPGFAYQFRVLQDNNPDGAVWLTRLLAS